MDNIKVSLIIPVFNAENFLDKALSSVVNQTFDNYEVIIINDGSTDNSGTIIDKYVKKYKNFTAITQKNSGPGKARNEGLKLATGEYITFLDGDDYLQPNHLEVLYNLCKDNDADISYCGFYTYLSKRIKFPQPLLHKHKVLDQKTALRRLIHDLTIHSYPWNKMFKRSIFTENNITFPEDMYFEDVATFPLTFFYANKVAITNQSLYNYIRHNTSILRTMNVQKINDFIKCFGTTRTFFEKTNTFDEYKGALILAGIKCIFVNLYSVLRLHILAKNFRGMGQNLKNANSSLFYILGKNFKVSDEPFELPAKVKLPKQKFKK